MSGRCVVLGKATDPAGRGRVRVTFKPESGGVLPNGEFVIPTPVTAFSDPDGTLRVSLVWSSVVGPYQVSMHGTSFEIWVPDAGSIRLSETIGVRRSPDE